MTSYHSHAHSYQNHPGRPIPSYNPVAAMTAPAGTFLPGTKVQVGNHRVVIDKYLSEGGFAHVYVVRLPQPVDSSEVAVLKRVAVPDKAALANMRTEVETMKRLRGHRHIVKYVDSHASQLRGGGFEVFLLMEYCAGGGLIDFMNTRLQNRLTEPEIIKIFSDVAEGVACMHYLKPPLLHRDLKVENVLISRHGNVSDYKLCDFGSSAPPRPAASTAAEGRLIEDDVQRHTTLQYRSPEMIDVYRKQPIDEKSDIWALGVLLYKLCYYTTPFEEVGQMAILNARYKFPSYPQFSDRIRMLISSMLREDPQKRPNVYQVVREVCHMRGKDVPIRDIYSNRSTSEARRYQQLPPSPTEQPQVGAVFAPPVQQETKVIPEVAPMRRGRPGKPAHSHDNSARPSPSPFRGPSTDPFAMLDGGSKSRNSTDEVANRFPSLDQFQILHEKGGKFDFEATVADKPEDEDLSRRLTNALADDAFVKRPSPERAAASEPSGNKRPLPTPLEKKPVSTARREETTRPAPLHQPVPQKPGMVSTGTMTSPPPPNLPERKPSSRPVFRFPVSDERRPPSQQMAAEIEKKKPESPSKFDLRPSVSSDRLSNLSVSARPSLEATRPSNLDADDPVVGRSKSANSKIRPVSVHAGSKFESPRGTESARSSLELVRPYEDGEPLQHARTDDYERANIASDVDYLRAKEEEEMSRKREKRHSGAPKHVKRSSLTTLSLSGTKTIFGGRFGDAFRRFESSHQDSRPQSPAATPAPDTKPKQPPTVTASEVVEPEDPEDDSDISPEMRRELERRRISQEEKRVANAADEYRRRVAEKGEGGRAGDGPRSVSIQNRVQTLFDDSNKESPKTAAGYGRFTETVTEQRSEQQVRTVSQKTAAYESPSPSKGKWQSVASSGVSRPQTTPAEHPQPRDTRPVAPPKPKNLRVGVPETTRPGSQHGGFVNEAPASASSDWETNFSRRFPSLSGLEMVETEIEIPRVASLRTKEV